MPYTFYEPLTAVDAAFPGDVVHVMDGTYVLADDSPIRISKDLTLIGNVADPAGVIVDGDCHATDVGLVLHVVHGVTLGSDLGEFPAQPLRIGDRLPSMFRQSQPTYVFHRTVRLMREEGLSHPGTVGGRALADRHVRSQAMRRIHLFDGDDLGAIKHAQVHRLAGLARQFLDAGQSLAVHLHVGQDHAPQLQELEPQAVEISIPFLFHDAHGTQRGEDAVSCAERESNLARDVGEGKPRLLERETFQDADRFAKGLEALGTGLVPGGVWLLPTCDPDCNHPADSFSRWACAVCVGVGSTA